MLDSDEFKRWISTAAKTLESARGDIERRDYNWAAFKSQQAGELAVKALLRGIGKPTYGHSISRLLSHIKQEISTPDNVLDCALLLDRLYIPTRYPDAWSEGSPYLYYTRKDALEAVQCAELIISWVESVWRKLLEHVGKNERG